jgi:hypothetical protein
VWICCGFAVHVGRGGSPGEMVRGQLKDSEQVILGMYTGSVAARRVYRVGRRANTQRSG